MMGSYGINFCHIIWILSKMFMTEDWYLFHKNHAIIKSRKQDETKIKMFKKRFFVFIYVIFLLPMSNGLCEKWLWQTYG